MNHLRLNDREVISLKVKSSAEDLNIFKQQHYRIRPMYSLWHSTYILTLTLLGWLTSIVARVSICILCRREGLV